MRARAVVALALVAAASGAASLQMKDEDAIGVERLVGVPHSDAGCDPVITTPASPREEPLDDEPYQPTVPASGGAYSSEPAPLPRPAFYSATDHPAVEDVVAYLRNGATVVWYQEGAPAPVVEDVRTLVKKINSSAEPDEAHVIGAPWPVERGVFPKNKWIAYTYWGQTRAHRQFCENVSENAANSFMTRHARPRTSPL